MPAFRPRSRPPAAAPAVAPPHGETRVLPWKGGKRAAFMIEFDDSAPSHLDYVIPALRYRGVPATFYINPGNGPFRFRQSEWESVARAPGIELANHTFSHIGAPSVDDFDQEIALANEVIDRLYPDRPARRLRSWARPGVPEHQWAISEKEIQAVLSRHLMIERPPFHGPPFSVRTIPEMQAWIEDAIEAGELRHLVFHGVGSDWHNVPLSYFMALLDRLEDHAGSLWVTHPLCAQKYAAERESARIVARPPATDSLALFLETDLDCSLYDEPLTLATRLPTSCGKASVSQAGRPLPHLQIGAEVFYDAVPGAGEILIRL